MKYMECDVGTGRIVVRGNAVLTSLVCLSLRLGLVLYCTFSALVI